MFQISNYVPFVWRCPRSPPFKKSFLQQLQGKFSFAHHLHALKGDFAIYARKSLYMPLCVFQKRTSHTDVTKSRVQHSCQNTHVGIGRLRALVSKNTDFQISAVSILVQLKESEDFPLCISLFQSIHFEIQTVQSVLDYATLQVVLSIRLK